jgi:hlyD family transporter
MLDIKLRQVYKQHLYNYRPSWIMRWGISVFFGILVVLIVGSSFIRYPDIVPAVAYISMINPPIALKAKVSGQIVKLLVHDGENVTLGKPLVVLESSANWEDILTMKRSLLYIDSLLTNYDLQEIARINLSPQLKLGDIQPQYAQLRQVQQKLDSHINSGLYEHNLNSLLRRSKSNTDLTRESKNKLEIMKQQYALILRDHQRDSILHRKGLISDSELEQAYRGVLQAKNAIVELQMSLKNTEIGSDQLADERITLDLNYKDSENTISSTLRQTLDALSSQLSIWEQSYLLSSTIEGKVSLASVWSPGQFIRAGEAVLTIIPSTLTQTKVRLSVPIRGSGKIKPKQRINIKLKGYPSNQYGMLVGEVASIAPVPTDSIYMVDAILPKGLVTSYGKTIPTTLELYGDAEIITEDVSLLMRFFNPLRALFDEKIK